MSTQYAAILKAKLSANPTFKEICDFNIGQCKRGMYERNKLALSNGTGRLVTTEQGIVYLASYSDMHRHKLNLAFESLFSKGNFNHTAAEIIDWGCGQAFASCCLIDFIKQKNIKLDLLKFTLIEPSQMSLQRGMDHIDTVYQKNSKVVTNLVNDTADKYLNLKQYMSNVSTKIHFFSNLLDMGDLDLNMVYQNVKNNCKGLNYFICVSPIRPDRLLAFFQMFRGASLICSNTTPVVSEIFRPTEMKKITKSIGRIEYVFKTNF